LGEEAVRPGVVLPDQVLGACDEVGERILLFEQLAALIPVSTELLTAPDVGDGVGETAVEQADPL
jgi:hypothetical protein